MSVNPVTFVAPHLAWGEARGASARAPGASPASGAVTDEQRSPSPNGAQPSGQRFFAAPAALLAPYRSAGGTCSSLAPCRGRKLLTANVTGFTLMTTKYSFHKYDHAVTERWRLCSLVAPPPGNHRINPKGRQGETPNPEIQTPNTKIQTPEKFQITSSKAATSRTELEFGAWDLFGVWSLVFGVFILVFGAWFRCLRPRRLWQERNRLGLRALRNSPGAGQ